MCLNDDDNHRSDHHNNVPTHHHNNFDIRAIDDYVNDPVDHLYRRHHRHQPSR